jgi:predicted MFS family arabinose efflux permease
MTPSDSPQSISPLSRKAILFYSCIFCYWAGVYIYMPILSPYAKSVSGSLQAVGLVMGAYGLSQLILRVPLGLLSDRLGRRKPFMLLGFLFDGIACVGLLFSNSTLTLFLSVLSSGIASSMWLAFTVFFPSYFPSAPVSQSMSLLHFLMRSSQVIANYSGGRIAEAWGWTAPFCAGLGFSCVGFFFALGIKERRQESGSTSSMRKLLVVGRNPRLLMISSLAMLMQFSIFAIIYGFTPIYAQQLGASKADLGALIFCFLVPNTVTSLVSGSLTRYIQERLIISVSFLLAAIPIFITPFTQHLWVLSGLLGVMGLGTGFIFPLLMGLSIKTMPLDQQATAMGFFQCIYAVGMSLGPIISGWLGESLGLNSVFIFNGTLCLFAAISSLKAAK